ncbi:unnamed protein product [Blepharisma stoltei]|uniref:Uncharacterized protein n=1 Tax=Blepharisma stoltei TaxID=1481888 RepID=A0AAU9KC93_9CILI|nr:unnamed protein product [Blepharisma stoltei]
MSKLRLKENQENSDDSKYLFTFSRGWNHDDRIGIHILDVESRVEQKYSIKFPRQTLFMPSIVRLPNNELACFGCFVSATYTNGVLYRDNIESFICIINSLTMKITRKLTFPGRHRAGCTTVFIKGYVYIICLPHNDTIYTLLKYDLSRNSLKKLARLKLGSYSLNLLSFEDNILIGSNDRNAYIYDLYSNSYSEIPLIAFYGHKVFISSKGRAYYLEFEGFIYESGFKNPYIWNKVKDFSPKYKINNIIDVTWVYYNGLIFLRNCIKTMKGYEPEEFYLEFNLDCKDIQRIDISKKKCNLF